MFRTELTILPQERLLSRTARVLTVGSCFADSIGEQLRLNKVTTLVNPFGTVFQPLALAQLLRAAAGEEQDWQQHLVEARGRWQSYDFHSIIGADSPVELLQTIQKTVGQVGDFLRTADTLVLTLGTAWAYRLRESGELVSNLHKLPASLFEKELLTADEIVNGLAEVHALVRRVNPNIRIILTVSPVRHIKDTLPLNAVSKSVLRVACHYLSELLPGVSYFPAYELLTDDLRDYRFYAADMLHPSEVAQDYIWEQFARAYFDADFGRFRKEWAAVRQALGHRPLHSGAPEHRAFLAQTLERLEKLAGQGVDMRQELRDVQRQLVALPPPRLAKAAPAEVEDDEERIDIGEDNGAEPAAISETFTQGPVEELEQRDSRRENRRNSRTGQDRRSGRPVPRPTPLETEAAPLPTLTEESLAAVEQPLPAADEPATVSQEEAAGYPAKKKKRRSRGGAKRTARKHAARLAAEQEPTQPDPAVEADLAGEQASATEAEATTAPLAAEAPPEAPAPAVEQPTDAASSAVAAPDAAGSARKRGTGPTPKKSKVITKSGLLKRGKRGDLYKSPVPEPTAETLPSAANAVVDPAPVGAEVTPERPAATPATPPAEVEAPDLAATVLGLYSSKPAAEAPKPKRGRPKAAPAPAPAPVEVAPAAEPAAAEAAPQLPPAPPAKRAAKAAKPASPKKATAKPAARRGRPPGPKSPPPDADLPII